jgi:hypothetical protein
MNMLKLVCTTFIVMLLSVAVTAQNAPPQGGQAQGGGVQQKGQKMKVDHFISQVDTDKDGRVIRGEWDAAGLREHVFITLDTNKDGYVSKEELEAATFPSGFDANKDGILILENIKAYDKLVDLRESSKGGTGGSGAPPQKQ